MPGWSNNNRAHTLTWFTLRAMEQSSRTFDQSEGITMDQLTFWSSAASDAMRSQQAKTLSAQMDNIFRMIWHATYEQGVSQAKAVGDIEAILTQAMKTIADLADQNDDNYSFPGEHQNA